MRVSYAVRSRPTLYTRVTMLNVDMVDSEHDGF